MGECWDLRVYLDVVNSLENGCKRAIEILREGSSRGNVKTACDLISSEIQHLTKVVGNFDKNPKVSYQSKLPFICLGKTKRSNETILPNYRQLKVTEFLQKPKSVKRKLVISSDSEVTAGNSEKDGNESPLDECPDLEDGSPADNGMSVDQEQDETILAAGPKNPLQKSSESVSDF